jgi:hypothetical protein
MYEKHFMYPGADSEKELDKRLLKRRPFAEAGKKV